MVALAAIHTWQCWYCRCYLGRIIDGILHEPNGGKSGLPCVRRCPDCGRRNVRLTG